MKHIGEKALLAVLVFVAALIPQFVDAATGANTTVQLEVLWWAVSITATWSFDFWSTTASTSAQTITWAFTDYFTVEDLKSAYSGYYTTLQLSGDLVWSGSNTISSGNVYASVTTTGVTLITGTANPRVVVADAMLSFQALNSAVTFIKRDPAANGRQHPMDQRGAGKQIGGWFSS